MAGGDGETAVASKERRPERFGRRPRVQLIEFARVCAFASSNSFSRYCRRLVADPTEGAG
jgi:hypothetical protein